MIGLPSSLATQQRSYILLRSWRRAVEGSAPFFSAGFLWADSTAFSNELETVLPALERLGVDVLVVIGEIQPRSKPLVDHQAVKFVAGEDVSFGLIVQPAADGVSCSFAGRGSTQCRWGPGQVLMKAIRERMTSRRTVAARP